LEKRAPARRALLLVVAEEWSGRGHDHRSDAWAVVMSPVGSRVVPFGAPKEIHEIGATLRFHRNSLSFYH
jgi:hypothetical protein